MEKKTLMTMLCLTAVLTLLAACSSGSDKKTEPSTSSTATSEQTSQASSTTTSESDTPKSELDLSGSQQVGQDDYGYVYVPKDWIRFQDIDGGNTYQYSDKSGYNVVTMFCYSKEDMGVEKIDDEAVKQAANSYASMMHQQGVFENLTGSMTKIADYEAYQVYGTVKTDGKILCGWLFRTEKSDRVYLISLEGDQKTFDLVRPYIKATWSETK